MLSVSCHWGLGNRLTCGTLGDATSLGGCGRSRGRALRRGILGCRAASRGVRSRWPTAFQAQPSKAGKRCRGRWNRLGSFWFLCIRGTAGALLSFFDSRRALLLCLLGAELQELLFCRRVAISFSCPWVDGHQIALLLPGLASLARAQ